MFMPEKYAEHKAFINYNFIPRMNNQ